MNLNMLKSWQTLGTLMLALACQPASPAAGQVSPEPPLKPEPEPLAAPAPSAPTAGEPESGREILGSREPGKALMLQGKPLHPGCVAQLETETNGDRVVQSIDWQGCTSSNRFSGEPYWEDGTFWYNETQEGDRSGYNVYRELDERTDILQAMFQSAHTYGSLHYLAVRRGEMIDWSERSSKPPGQAITTLTRLGEVIAAEDVEALIRHATKK